MPRDVGNIYTGSLYLAVASALTETDRCHLRFADMVERTLLDQRRDENRDISETLGRAWQALATLPRRELTMLPSALLDRYLPAGETGR